MADKEPSRRDELFARYDEKGANAMTDSELIELLLAHTSAEEESEVVAARLLTAYGSFRTLLGASPQSLMSDESIDEAAAVLLAMVSPMAARMKLPPSSGMYLRTPEEAGTYAISLFAHDKMESFYVLFLDSRKKLIATELVGQGTIDEVPVYPRQIAELAVKYRSGHIILAHNHPTGLLSASSKDYVATTAICNTLREFEVRVVDHIIVGDGRYYSFAEKTLLEQ